MGRSILYFIVIMILVISGSIISSRLWSGPPEDIPEDLKISIKENMTIAAFGKEYNLNNRMLKSIFNLKSPQDLQKKLSETGLNENEISRKVNQSLALQAEHATKNWFKIPLKGILWLIFLSVVLLSWRMILSTSWRISSIRAWGFTDFAIFLPTRR